MNLFRPHLMRRPAGAPVRGRGARALVLLVALGVLAASAARAPGADSTSTTEDDRALIGTITPGSGAETLPAVPVPFRRGESLRFSVDYGFINAGSAYLEVPDLSSWKGRPAFTLRARAESNKFVDNFLRYKVRNQIESVWDSAGHFSWRYQESRREGKHRAKNEIVFDYDRQEALYADGRTFPIPPGVQDALSAFYYTRTQALPLGGSVYFDYHASRKSVPLEVKVLGRERVETPAGTFDCVVIEPLLKAGGIFKNKGRLVIWLTDDERRMPVLMKSKVLIGSIRATLVDVKTGV